MNQQPASIPDLDPAVEALLELARQRRWMSYEEMNNTLPDEMVDATSQDELPAVHAGMAVERLDGLEYLAGLYGESAAAPADTQRGGARACCGCHGDGLAGSNGNGRAAADNGNGHGPVSNGNGHTTASNGSGQNADTDGHDRAGEGACGHSA